MLLKDLVCGKFQIDLNFTRETLIKQKFNIPVAMRNIVKTQKGFSGICLDKTTCTVQFYDQICSHFIFSDESISATCTKLLVYFDIC